jgi:hypothetical protein
VRRKIMNKELTETNKSKNSYFKWRTFLRFGTLYFALRLVVDSEARRPIGGEGGWFGVVSLAIEVSITALLFSLAWQAIVNWRQKNSLKQ